MWFKEDYEVEMSNFEEIVRIPQFAKKRWRSLAAWYEKHHEDERSALWALWMADKDRAPLDSGNGFVWSSSSGSNQVPPCMVRWLEIYNDGEQVTKPTAIDAIRLLKKVWRDCYASFRDEMLAWNPS